MVRILTTTFNGRGWRRWHFDVNPVLIGKNAVRKIVKQNYPDGLGKEPGNGQTRT